MEKRFYRTTWGRKREIKMTETHFEGDNPAMTEPPGEEGNDQESSEGAEAEPVEEGDVEDAPEPDPNASDDPDAED